MSQQNVDTVKAAYQAFQSGDMQGAVQDFASDIEWASPDPLPWGGTQHGPDEVIAGWARIPESMDEFSVELVKALDAGDHVVVIGRSHGRAKASGTEVTSDYVHVFEFRDGKAANVRVYLDPTETLRALEGQAVA